MAPPDNPVVIPYAQLEETLQSAASRQELYQDVVDAPYEFKVEMALLFLGFICLYIVDEDEQLIRAGAVSDTEHYRQSIAGYDFKIEDYKIALDDPKNIVASAIRDQAQTYTEDWGLLSRPTAREDIARLNQANSGIAYSVVQPLAGKVRGALMYNYFQYKDAIGEPQDEFMARYTALVSSRLSDAANH